MRIYMKNIRAKFHPHRFETMEPYAGHPNMNTMISNRRSVADPKTISDIHHHHHHHHLFDEVKVKRYS